MLSIVHAAEVQFRRESALREREFAVLAAIRERAAEAAADRLAAPRAARPAAQPAAWPRPIGARHAVALDCPAAA